jgi:hypothetical protein
MAQEFTPPPGPVEEFPVTPPARRRNTTVWIIVAIVVVLLCCCCVLVVAAYMYGDPLLDQFNFSGLLNYLL